LPELINKNNVSCEAMLCSLVVYQRFEAAFHLRVQFDISSASALLRNVVKFTPHFTELH